MHVSLPTHPHAHLLRLLRLQLSYLGLQLLHTQCCRGRAELCRKGTNPESCYRSGAVRAQRLVIDAQADPQQVVGAQPRCGGHSPLAQALTPLERRHCFILRSAQLLRQAGIGA